MIFFKSFLFLAGAFTAAGVVNAVDPSSYFGGTEIPTYLDWLKKSTYERHAWIESASDSALGVAIHWTTDDTHIQLAVAANATGWVGFGLAESGSMRGADIIMYTAETDELVDSYVLDDLVTPMPDDCQSWTLINSIAQDGFIIFESTRALNTGDSQDRVIIDDSNNVIPATRVIAAWGDSSSPSYHGLDNRAKSSVRFMGNVSSDEELAMFQSIVTSEAEGNFTLQAVNYSIPAVETTYAYFCFFTTDLLAMGVPMDQDLHTIGIEPIVDARSTKYIHHFILYATNLYSNSSYPCDPSPGIEIAYVWAPGDTQFNLPMNVGGPLGTSGFQSFKLEIHYNNPSLDAGQLDSSGVRFYYTSKKRQYDLGILQIGDPGIRLFNVTVSKNGGLSGHTFDCPSSCSAASVAENVTVIAEHLHMHKSGVSMSNSQIRDSQVVHVGEVQFWDFAQQGNIAVVQEPFEILPGDSFRTSCNYNANNGEVFGLGSSQEMCIAFLFYYPRQKLASPYGDFSYMCGFELFGDLFPECNADLTSADFVDLSQVGRSFGVAPSTCPVQPAAAPTSASHGDRKNWFFVQWFAIVAFAAHFV